MWMENVSESESDGQECPTCGGPVLRRAHGEMYAGAQILDGERVEIRREPDAGYQDPIFLDPITQYFDGSLYRIYPNQKYYTKGGSYLHRDVWQMAFGAIPEGCHIHHINGERADNRIGNLECLPSSEHLSRTWYETKSGVGDHFTEKARQAAADWHRSEEGRLWHSRQARRSKSWEKWERKERDCVECGKKIMALVRKNGYAQKFCGVNCKSRHYRKRKAAERAK